MQLIGLVGSGSTTTYAPLIIWDRYEHIAKEEQLVLIKDSKRDIEYLGILRSIRRYEPFLTTYRRTSYVDNPELVKSGTLPHSSGYVALIGILSRGSERTIVETDLPPNPGSEVYVIESQDDINLGLREGLEIGFHKYSGITIPLDPRGLQYHIGIVGATGTGKSRLVRALVEEIKSKTDYNIIIFDHTGLDYTPYYSDCKVEASNIVLDISLITDLILRRTGLDARTYEQYIIYAILKYIFEYYSKTDPSIINELTKKEIQENSKQMKLYGRGIGGDKFKKFLDSLDFEKLLEVMAEKPIKWDRSEFKRIAMDVVDELKGRTSTKIRLGVAIDIKLGNSFFESLCNRRLLAKNIVDKAFSSRLVVVDLSTEDMVSRRYIVANVVKELWSIIESKREPVKTIVVVDEAHNYACRNCGESHYAITRIAREGRKWGLGIVLATQRIIDIDPEIRSNINTWLFSKLQTPNDYNELKGYMDLAGITEQSLAILGRREFYLAGLMNPLRIPILIRVKEVE